jgi:hypothetical protein
MHENCLVLKVVHEALVIWEGANAEQRLAGRQTKSDRPAGDLRLSHASGVGPLGEDKPGAPESMVRV